MAHQYVFVMKGLTKVYPPNREVLKDIWLSFLPGRQDRRARPQRRGQEHAAADHGGPGHRVPSARPGPPTASGWASCPRSRSWTRPRPWRQVVDEGVAGHARPARASSTRSTRSSPSPWTPTRWRSCWPSRPGCRTRSTRPAPGSSTARSRSPWTPCAAPRGRRGRHPLRRRAAPRGPVPAAAAAARPAAAGRAHQPPRRRVGGLAGAPPARVPGHRGGRHPRPLLPGQRGRLDPGAGPRPRHPLGGQLLLLAGAEGEAPGPGGEADHGPPQDPRAGARVDPHGPPGAPGQGQGAAQRLRGAAPDGGRPGPGGGRGHRHPARAAPGRPGGGGRGPVQGLRRPAAVRRPELPAAAGRHRRRHRPQRRRQDDPVPHDHGAGAARRGHPAGRRDGDDGLRRPEPRRPGRREDGLGGDLRQGRLRGARQAQGELPRLRRRLQLQGRGPAEAGPGPLRRRAQPGPPGQAAQARRQPDPARRADQRPGRGHPAGPGGGAAGVRRLRPGRLSHDRWFLDRIATHILAFEGDSRVVWFEGNYQDYEADRKRRLGAEADQPHRIRYKKLTR